MTAQHYSIRKRLLLWISMPILVISLLILLLAFLFARHEIEEVYDSQLVHTAKTLLQFTEHEMRESQTDNIFLGEEDPRLQHNYEKKTAFRIWLGDSLILQSAQAKEFPAIEAPPGFSDQSIDGQPWRFFVYIDAARNLRIEASERYSIRYELITQLMFSLAIPMGILIPSLLVIVWVGVRKSLKPLMILSRTVDTRDTDDLSPIDNAAVPVEVMPLALALNRLFTRIGDSFRKEREFTDHAAHELRTPLAAMKTQTQVLMKKAAAMPECREGLENLNSTIDRSTHLLDQLLSLARLQNENFPMSDLNLSECLEGAAAEAAQKAKDKGQTLNIFIADNVRIKGHEDSLYILLRNLLDNAIKYTPAGGMITAALAKDAVITISDSGPGIADADKSRVFSRFVRADKSGQTGSGLGLSIVQWIADAHGAALTLKDNLPCGLTAELDFRS